jgi:hypothetical protein
MDTPSNLPDDSERAPAMIVLRISIARAQYPKAASSLSEFTDTILSLSRGAERIELLRGDLADLERLLVSEADKILDRHLRAATEELIASTS